MKPMVRHLSVFHDMRVEYMGSTRYRLSLWRDLTTCFEDRLDCRHLAHTTRTLKISANLQVLAGTWYDGEHSFQVNVSRASHNFALGVGLLPQSSICKGLAFVNASQSVLPRGFRPVKPLLYHLVACMVNNLSCCSA